MKLASTKALALLAPLCLVTASFAPVQAPEEPEPIDRPSHQSGAGEPSEQERSDLAAFMHTLSGLREGEPARKPGAK